MPSLFGQIPVPAVGVFVPLIPAGPTPIKLTLANLNPTEPTADGYAMIFVRRAPTSTEDVGGDGPVVVRANAKAGQANNNAVGCAAPHNTNPGAGGDFWGGDGLIVSDGCEVVLTNGPTGGVPPGTLCKVRLAWVLL